MVVTVEEDDIEAVAACVVEHVEYVICVLLVAVVPCPHRVMKRQMGDNENRGLEADSQLVVEVVAQILCRALNGGFVVVIPHIVVLVDNENAVFAARRVIVSALGKARCARLVMVALAERRIIVIAVDNAGDRAFERGNACRRLIIAVAVVAAAKESVRRSDTCSSLELSNDALHEGLAGIIAARVLIVRARNDRGKLPCGRGF